MNTIPTDPATDDPAETREGLYPIRTVSQLTGVNAVTLRAWERRYGLINPHRTPKGHRLYTQADIDLINRVVSLVNRGVPISQVPGHLASEPGDEAGVPDAWSPYRARMLTAITRFDEAALDAAYNEALSLYPVDVVTERLIVPLLRELGERWRDQPGGIAEEHFFGSYMRNKLGARLHHLAARNARPRLLAACLPGEHHELGLLLFCLAASAHGLGFVILGADMPLDDLAHAAPRSGCDGVLLSGSITVDPPTLTRELRALVAAIDGPVFVGGVTAVLEADAIARGGAIALGSDTPAAIRHVLTHFKTPAAGSSA
ncbi:MAG TPA: MerR family transcriptional regulator [Thioalkalivibrio sp.]|nr:MerR family transcriptional regulator [Thioalkalivibrio sp.]